MPNHGQVKIPLPNHEHTYVYFFSFGLRAPSEIQLTNSNEVKSSPFFFLHATNNRYTKMMKQHKALSLLCLNFNKDLLTKQSPKSPAEISFKR